MATMTDTYEAWLAKAEKMSRDLGKYAAVVEIATYLSSSPPRMTVAVGDREIVSRQRSGEFVGVVAQFYRGGPIHQVAAVPAAAVAEDTDELPF